MKTSWPGFIRFHSAAIGSFTFMIMSDAGPHRVGVGADLRARCHVLRVLEPAPLARPLFHHHLVARRHECFGAGRYQRDPVFVRLDFLWNADLHCR